MVLQGLVPFVLRFLRTFSVFKNHVFDCLAQGEVAHSTLCFGEARVNGFSYSEGGSGVGGGAEE
jgi:hypothetical protein